MARTKGAKNEKPCGPLYSLPEKGALGFFRWIQHHQQVRAGMVLCKKCGNDRLANPDSQGKCRKCRNRLQAARTHRRRSALLQTEGGRARLRNEKRAYRQLRTPAFLASQREHRRRRKARIKGCAVLPVDWSWILSLYGSKCLRCGKNETTMDHVVPLAHGGAHASFNLQPLCHICSSTKNATDTDYRPFPFYPRPTLVSC